jgi:addiction module HigA family antidote
MRTTIEEEATMSDLQGSRMKNPAHPGGFVKSEIIAPLGLTVTDAALALRVTRPALSALLNERVSLTPDMGLRIEKAFGVPMDTLMRMQNSFDIAQARRRESEIEVPPYAPKPPADPQPKLL